MSGDLASNTGTLGDFLKTTRAGVKLPAPFARAIQTTLLETFEVDSEDGLMQLGAQIVWSAVEADYKEIKPVLGDLFFRWLNDNPAVKAISSQASPPNAQGGGNSSDKQGAGTMPSEVTTEADSIAGALNKTECACLSLEVDRRRRPIFRRHQRMNGGCGVA